ncbi:MAG: hypothetical protein ACRDDY_03195, partial [Clostridium sp.]|uniref:hypothetical protein n=1 Tax=Clostridium sp. TaxID=1506 RepID=UPI003EE53D9C
MGRVELSEEQKEISKAVNEFAQSIYKTGTVNTELSQFLIKVIEPEVANAPSEILSMLFNEGEIGEFDEQGVYASPKNTLVARASAARTGNVDKSYIDFTRGNKFTEHLQIETEIKMSDLRRDGALTIAQLVVYAIDAFNNKKFNLIFDHVDGLIQGGDQLITSAGTLTQEAMDKFAGYLEDRGNAPVIVGLSTVLRGIKNMSGYENFMSENMKDKLYAASILEMYNGVNLASVKAGVKLGDGSSILPEGRLFGIADKIGDVSMKGELRALQTVDNNREVIELKFTGFEFTCVITDIEKLAELNIQ